MTPIELVLATARNAVQQQRQRVRDAIKADLRHLGLAATTTETGRALLAAAPPEVRERVADLLAEDPKP